MSTEWIYRIDVIVSASEREAANGVAALVEPDEGRSPAFLVPLSATGNEPVTHVGVSTPATEDMRRKMEIAIDSGVLRTVRFYRTDAATGELQETSSGIAAVGSAWTWAGSVADCGLQQLAHAIA